MWFQDGKIEAEVKLTGVLSLGALMPGEFRKYGTMIAPGLYAPVHQHFFVARMDMSVDSKPGEALNQVTWIGLQNFAILSYAIAVYVAAISVCSVIFVTQENSSGVP